MTATKPRSRRSRARANALAPLAWCMADHAQRIEAALVDVDLVSMASIAGVTADGLSAAAVAQLTVLAPVAQWAAEDGGDVAELAARVRTLTPSLRTLVDEAAASIESALRELAQARTVLDRLDVLARVVEPMLAACDARARRAHGAWYTPQSVVRLQLARADAALRGDGVPGGLIDPNVRVVDPACGTGLYLLEWLRLASERGGATSPPLGVDIAPVPAAVARIVLNTATRQLGIDKRATPHVVCRDALAIEPDDALIAARHLVVIGNPPYRVSGSPGPQKSGRAATSDALEPYRRGLREEFGVRKTLVTDAYVRFIRQAERWLLDAPYARDAGAVRIGCLITNANWLDGLAFPAMRRHLAERFDAIAIDYLGGGRHDTQARADNAAHRDGNVFTDGDAPGIARAVAIATFTRRASQRDGESAAVGWTAWHGDATQKLDALDARATDLLRGVDPDDRSRTATLSATDGYRIGPPPTAARRPPTHIASWVPLNRCFAHAPLSGYQPGRGDTFRAFDRDTLASAMQAYFDPTIGDRELARDHPLAAGLLQPQAGGFGAPADVRAELLERGAAFEPARLRRYLAFPFDARWLYDDERLLHRRRPRLTAAAAIARNAFLCACPRVRTRDRLGYAIVSTLPPGYYVFESHARAFAKWLPDDEGPQPGLAPWLIDHVASTLGLGRTDAVNTAFQHLVAVALAPAHQRACDSVPGAWPAIPIPRDADRLRASADAGAQALDAMVAPDDASLDVDQHAPSAGDTWDLPDATRHLRLGGYGVWRHWTLTRRRAERTPVLIAAGQAVLDRLAEWTGSVTPALDANAKALMALPARRLRTIEQQE